MIYLDPSHRMFVLLAMRRSRLALIPHPFFNVNQAAFKSLDTIQYVAWRHVIINLTVVCVLVRRQSMLGDHLAEFGPVRDEEQMPQTAALWHSEQNWLDWRKLTIERHLPSPPNHKGRQPLKSRAAEAEVLTQQQLVIYTVKRC